MTRYVHSDDWDDDPCPNAEPEYGAPHAKHASAQPASGYDGGYKFDPGDRLQYMTCKHCGAVVWGFSVIEEEPF